MSQAARTRLQEVLWEEGRKQSWLAERIGVDQAHLSRIVNGLHASEAMQTKIAEALGREVGDLWPQEVEAR